MGVEGVGGVGDEGLGWKGRCPRIIRLHADDGDFSCQAQVLIVMGT